MPMATATAAPMPVATATMPVATARPMTSMPMPTATAEPFVPPMAAAPQPMTMAPQPTADDGDDRTIIGHTSIGIPIIAAARAPQRTVPIGSIPPGGTQPLWSAQELAGTWINCCLPNGCFISQYTAVSEDKMKHIECCAAVFFVFPFPLCKEVLMRVRQGDTNRFRGKFDYDENGGESFESKTCWCEYHNGLPYDCYMKLLPI